MYVCVFILCVVFNTVCAIIIETLPFSYILAENCVNLEYSYKQTNQIVRNTCHTYKSIYPESVRS